MKSIISRIISFVMIVCLVISSAYVTSYAEESSEKVYSNVLDDLKEAPNFKTEDYPLIAGDSSLRVIHLAESIDNELFVYVYQPGGAEVDLRASTINISTALRTKAVFYNYDLTYLNSNGVFYKYKVADFSVSDKSERCYEVSSIFRAWNSAYDEPLSNGNTVSEVPFQVGKQFVYTTDSNGNDTLTVEDTEYIEITNKYVGYVRYTDATASFGIADYTNFDAHFVAIDTNRKMDELLEADIFFKQDSYTKIQRPNTSGTSYDTEEFWTDPEKKYVYIDFEDKAYASYGDVFVSHERVWDRIQTTSEFLSQANKEVIYQFPGFKTTSTLKFTDEAYEALSQTKWVLSFVETESYTSFNNLGGTIRTVKYHVGDVSLLRLKFITDGEVYDLGVVDNKQSGSKDPSGEMDFELDFNLLGFPGIQSFFEKAKIILSIVLLVFLLIVIRPFKLIKKLFDKIFGDTKKQK